MRGVLLIILLAGLAACGGPAGGPEDQVREYIATGVTAAESKARRDLVDMISPAYADARGNSRDDIGNMLRLYFLRAQTVNLVPHISEVRVIAEDAAEVELTVGMAGATDSALGFSADAYRFELQLESQGGDWQLISARWAELGAELR
jgi:hypothetical protein